MAARPDVLLHFGAETSGADAAMHRLAASASGLRSSLNSGGGLIGGLIGGFSLKKFIELNVEMEQISESVKRAGGSMQELTAIAKANAVGVDGVATSYVRLKNLNLDASRRTIEAFLNVAAGTRGKTVVDFVEAVADATVAEWERLKEFGIKAKVESDGVAITFRGNTQKIKNDAKSIQEALVKIGEVEFAGAAAAKANTLGGALENLSSTLKELAFNPQALSGTTQSIKDLTETLSNPKLNAGIDSLTSGIFTSIKGLVLLTALGDKAAKAFEDLREQSISAEDIAVLTNLEARDRLLSAIERKGELIAGIKEIELGLVKEESALARFQLEMLNRLLGAENERIVALQKQKQLTSEITEAKKAGAVIPPDRKALPAIGAEKGALDFLKPKAQTWQDLLPPEQGPQRPARTIEGPGTGTRPFGNAGVGASDDELAALREKFDAEQAEQDRFDAEQAAKQRAVAEEMHARTRAQAQAEGDIWAQYRAEQAAAADGNAEEQKLAQAAQVEALKRIVDAGASDAAKSYYGKLVGEVEANLPTAKMKVVMTPEGFAELPAQLQASLNSGQYTVTLSVRPILSLESDLFSQGIRSEADRRGGTP